MYIIWSVITFEFSNLHTFSTMLVMVLGFYYCTFAGLGGMGGGIPIVLLKVLRYFEGLESTIIL
jgi:hypothetical protein